MKKGKIIFLDSNYGLFEFIKINRMRFLVLFITILLCSNTIKAQRLYSESGDFSEKE